MCENGAKNRFGTQPIVKGKMQEAFPTASPLMLSGTAGAIVGVGEVALLPFDVLKIKMQTNAAALQGLSFMDIAKQEGLSGLSAPRPVRRSGGERQKSSRSVCGKFAMLCSSGNVELFARRYRGASWTALRNAPGSSSPRNKQLGIQRRGRSRG